MLFLIASIFSLTSYITGGNSFPAILTADEEEKYLRDYNNGDMEAKNKLIVHNLRLVAHIAKKYSNQNPDNASELISIGTIGLIKGVNTYKLGHKTKLATYAAKCIENEILMSIRSSKKHNNDIYLQDTIGVDGDGNEVKIEDKLADTDKSIEDEIELKIKVALLYDKLKKVLRPREQTVIKLRYGLNGNDELTQREIASSLKISRSYVSRIEKKALKKLLKEMDMCV